MFIGTYRYTLDAKGRVNLPTDLRDDLGSGFILTQSTDGCLSAYPMAAWEELVAKVAAQPASKAKVLRRYLSANANNVTVDKQGRILIPQALREHAGIEKDVVIVGATTCAEIWSAERWERFCESMTDESVEEEMALLGL